MVYVCRPIVNSGRGNLLSTPGLECSRGGCFSDLGHSEKTLHVTRPTASAHDLSNMLSFNSTPTKPLCCEEGGSYIPNQNMAE